MTIVLHRMNDCAASPFRIRSPVVLRQFSYECYDSADLRVIYRATALSRNNSTLRLGGLAELSI